MSGVKRFPSLIHRKKPIPEGYKVFSASMKMTFPPVYPFSPGSWAVTLKKCSETKGSAHKQAFKRKHFTLNAVLLIISELTTQCLLTC